MLRQTNDHAASPLDERCPGTEKPSLTQYRYELGQAHRDAARTPLVHKTERPRDDGLRLETIITRRAAPGYVLVRSHQHQPASVDRDEIRLIEP